LVLWLSIASLPLQRALRGFLTLFCPQIWPVCLRFVTR
jgi:hypothetical protein